MFIPRSIVLIGICFASCSPCTAQDAPAVDAGTAALIDLLPQLDDAAAQLDILRGILAGLEGQRQIEPPANWDAIYRDHLAKSESDEVRQIAQLLALQFGDEAVRTELMRLVGDEAAALERRREAITALAEVRASDLPETLHELLSGSALRRDALVTLAEFGNDETPAAVIEAYPQFDLAEKRIAIDVLSSSPAAARQMLEAVRDERIQRTDLGAETIRKLKLLGDESIEAAIRQHWGTVRETPEAKAARIAELKALLTSPTEREPDLPRGRAIFAKTCRQCHTLYGDGEQVGPDITGTNRGDLDYLLVNVVDPNSTVGKDYQATSVMTDSGKLYVGLVVGEDDRVLSLRTETDTLQIPQEEIEFRELTPQSMMPEGILDPLPEPDLRDLVAYLRSSRQVPLLATQDTASQFFNDRDLSLWTSFGGDWRVTGGELRGEQTDPQVWSESLLSDFLLDEFVLDTEVQFTGRQGMARIVLAPWLGDSPVEAGEGAGEPRIVTIDLKPNDETTGRAAGDRGSKPPSREGAAGWHTVSIRRTATALRVELDGTEVPHEPIDVETRLRLAFRLEDNADGEFLVRGLTLRVPPGEP